MAFPRKFKNLLEIELHDVESPDYLWLTYAVCAVFPDSCGWGGWMIEAAFKKTIDQQPTATGDRLVSAFDQQICPRCGKRTFRTGASMKFVPSSDQTRPSPEGADYTVEPIEYED